MPGIASVSEYTTVLAQVFSPDGQLYCAGTAAGDLAVWRVSVLVGRGDKKGPVVVWKPHSSCAQRDVLSLTTTQDFLLTGGRGEVRAWGWEEINQGNVGQPQWALDVPGGGEVNSMLVATGGTAGRLVLGTGDNNVYVFDLETRKLSSTYTGHTDYIHYVAAGREEGGTLASASEDGTVRLWDQRKKRRNQLLHSWRAVISCETSSRKAHKLRCCFQRLVGLWRWSQIGTLAFEDLVPQCHPPTCGS